jgi:hypothetical protein
MLVHHLNAVGSKVRGHSSIYANVDQVLLVTRDEMTKIRTVVLDKQKDDEEGSRFQFDLPQVVIGIDDEGRQVTSCVCTAVGDREKISREEALKGIRISALNEAFMRAFFEAEKRYGFPVPYAMAMPTEVRTLVFWEDVKRAFGETNPNDFVAPAGQTTEEAAAEETKWRERMRKRIEKCRVDLTNLGVLGITTHEGKSVVFHTGRALRAFDFTWKNREDKAAAGDPSLAIEF